MTMMSLFCAIPAFLALALVSNVSASGGCFKITAAFSYGNSVYLVDGNDYIKLNEHFREDVRGTMKDLFNLPGHIDAINTRFRKGQIQIYLGNNVYHFLYPSKAFRYIDAASSVHPYFGTGVDAVVTFVGADYIFKGCSVLPVYENSRISFEDLRKIGLPCNVDAAFSVNGYLYVIKGLQYWVKRSLYKDFEGPNDLRALFWLPNINLCPN